MAHKIERVTDSFLLGEGPHWDAKRQTLYFVDIQGSAVFRYTPASNKFAKASVGSKHPSFIIPVDGKEDQFVISLDNELVIISWDGESDEVEIVDTLSVVTEPVTPNTKFNDAKCDSSGRLWAGVHVIDFDSIPETPPLGTLYSFDPKKRELISQVERIRIANGLAFNDKTKKLFYIDSLKGTVDQYDFDIINGKISNGKVFFTLSQQKLSGLPDGMTIDTNGNLFVANFGGGRVLKIDGKKPETLLETINLPAVEITSVAFGGKNLDELYVTSASLEYEGKTPEQPVNGATYRVTGTGSKGFPGVSFKI